MFFSIAEIDRLIKEDVPYLDLTSWALGIGEETGQITYFTREEGVVCGTEEVRQIFDRLGIKLDSLIPSGKSVRPGDHLIAGSGPGRQLHLAWKVGQNILDHCSGIATKTKGMVSLVKEVDPNIAVLTTRKGFPGTKPLAIKGILVGGAMPHRLGLSETVLIFQQHLDLIGGFEALLAKMPRLRIECREKKIIVETSDLQQARRLCEAGADGIQFEKLKPEVLREYVKTLKEDFPGVIFLAAGGIDESNVVAYAQTGAHGIVTTALYGSNPLDIGVRMALV